MATEQLDMDLSERLQEETAATRVSVSKFGVRRTLSKDKVTKAAQAFNASSECLRATKRLLDTKGTAFLAVTGVFYKISTYWKMSTIPFPESGIRLLRRDRVEEFNQRMAAYRDELHENVAQLDAGYESLREKARVDLGELFDENDYPSSIASEFNVQWEFPSVRPPNYLKDLNPELYEAQEARVKKKFDEAIALTEEAFSTELHSMVTHLFERLSPQKVAVWVYQGRKAEDLEATIESLRDQAEEIQKADAVELLDEDMEKVIRLRAEADDLGSLLALAGAGAIELRNVNEKATVTAVPEKGRRQVFPFETEVEAKAWLETAGCRFERETMENKTFRDTAVDGMRTFFDRFAGLNIGSNEALDNLVAQAKQLVGGVKPSELRDNAETRARITEGLGDLRTQIEDMLIDRPSRAITFGDD